MAFDFNQQTLNFKPLHLAHLPLLLPPSILVFFFKPLLRFHLHVSLYFLLNDCCFKFSFFHLLQNMTRKFDCIKDISDKKETWRLAVRIIDSWSFVNSKGAEHLEMVIMDAAVYIFHF